MVQCWKSLHSELPIQLPDPIRNHQWRTETVQKASNLSWRTGVNDQPTGNTLCRYGMEDAWSIGDSNCRFIWILIKIKVSGAATIADQPFSSTVIPTVPVSIAGGFCRI